MTGAVVMAASVSENDGYAAPTCQLRGGARSALVHPEGFSLWRVDASLDEAATVTWSATHGDEALYVLSGEIKVEGDGRSCGPRDAVVVEAGVVASVSVLAPTKWLHFGPVEGAPPDDGPFGPPLPDGHGVHVVPFEVANTLQITLSLPAATMTSYADSLCPTCRINLFHVDRGGPSVSKSHIHSQDEIIHVLTGEIQVGHYSVSAGMSVAVPAKVRYGFRAKDRFAFLSYRRDASYVTYGAGSERVLESVECPEVD